MGPVKEWGSARTDSLWRYILNLPKKKSKKKKKKNFVSIALNFQLSSGVLSFEKTVQ